MRNTPAYSGKRLKVFPEEEREVFDLVRIQGFTQVEVADVLGVSPKTVQRRLNSRIVVVD